MSNYIEFYATINVPAKTRLNPETGQRDTIKPATRKVVLVSIDKAALAAGVATNAANNRTGRAVIGGGAVLAKVFTRSAP